MHEKGNRPAGSVRKKKKKLSARLLIFMVTGLSFAAFLGCRLMLNSYNAYLSQTNTELSNEISATLDEIDQLKTEVASLQEKTSVLGMLDYQVTDNQNNVYVIDNN